MLLDHLKEFEWNNEPDGIAFNDDGMQVVAAGKTDFWHDNAQQMHKNNAAYFFTPKLGDFECKAGFIVNDFKNFCQAGIMIKVNDGNAFKVSLMSASVENPQIGTSLTIDGFSDWAIYPIGKEVFRIYFKILKKGNLFFVFYSTDDINYALVRQFSFTQSLIEVKVGAYFASPSENEYKSTLKSIEIK